MGFTATVRVTGSAGRFEDFQERVRWLLVRDVDAEPYTEHHAPGRWSTASRCEGPAVPAFVSATADFPELRVEVVWDKDGARGGAAIENGRLVDKWTGERGAS